MQGLYPEPVLRPIADIGVLVEFGDCIHADIHERVLNFDAAVQHAAISGLTERTPSYTSVYVGYNPLETDFDTVCTALLTELESSRKWTGDHSHWTVPVCYSERFAPDLPELQKKLGISPDEFVDFHTSGNYTVYLYGFAPGFAYLGGVPDAIQLPRKPAPVMNVPTGSLIIAGPQALITTVVMPSGWWNVGRTTFSPLQESTDRPFLFNVGDTVEFVSISETEFLALSEPG